MCHEESKYGILECLMTPISVRSVLFSSADDGIIPRFMLWCFYVVCSYLLYSSLVWRLCHGL